MTKPYLILADTPIPGEIWKDVINYDGRYEVSNFGRIRSLPNKVRKTTRILKQSTHKSGYLTVNLTSNVGVWIQKTHWVAIIVARSFKGPKPSGCEACHNNGDFLDNAETNLRWDTPVSNQADRVLHGTSNIGSSNPRAKLTEPKVIEIKRLISAGNSDQEISDLYGVTYYAIKNIRNGYNWSHIHV